MPGYELTAKTARQHAGTRKKEKEKRKAQSQTHMSKSTTKHRHTHSHTCAHKHTAAVMRVDRDRHGDKTTFCILSCETPQEYS